MTTIIDKTRQRHVRFESVLDEAMLDTSRPFLDLNRAHFRKSRGQITAFGTWYGDHRAPCIALLPTYLIGMEGLTPCIVPLETVWFYCEENVDHPTMIETTKAFAEALGMNKESRSDRHAIVSLVNDCLDDFLKMPPFPRHEFYRPVADAIRTDANGTQHHSEIMDDA